MDNNKEIVQEKLIWQRFINLCKVANIPFALFGIYALFNLLEIIFMVKIPQVNADFFSGDASVESIAMFLGCELLITVIVQVDLYINHVLRAQTNRNLRNALWGKLLTVKSKYYDKVSSTTLLSRITLDTESFNTFLLDIVWQFIMGIYTLVLTLKEMSEISLNAAYKLLLFSPVLLIFTYIMGKISMRLRRQEKSQLSGFTTYLSELMTSLPIVKSFNQQDYEVKRGRKVIDDYSKAQSKLIYLDVIGQIVSSLLGVVPEILIIIMGVRMLTNNNIDAAGWYVFYIYAGTLLSYVSSLGSYWEKTKTLQGELNKVSEVLFEEDEGLDSYIKEIIDSNDIGFDNVCFGYDEQEVLHDVSMTLYHNQTNGIIGFSGSGKSTVLKLIERLYEPTNGKVLINGHSLSDYDIHNWRNKLSVVSQNSPMINGTIRENITYGLKREVADEEIMLAARAAYVEEFILKCPDGLNHDVGQFGNKLSGGQRQKLSLARAILQKPEYLILDEPTASLDILSTNEIASTIARLHGTCTIIIVAHEPKIIASCDHIVMMENGRVVVEGTQKELQYGSSFYQQLTTSLMSKEEDYE